MTADPKFDPPELRPSPPPVTRLSRGVLMSLGGLGAAAVLGAAFWALHPPKLAKGGQENYVTDAKPGADGLAALPHDYAGMQAKPEPPRLGPPLPGDFGKPLLKAQRDGAMAGPAGADPEAMRRQQEDDQAAHSKVFFQTTSRPNGPAGVVATGGTVAAPSPRPDGDPEFRQNMQDRKEAFLAAPADHDTLSAQRLQQPVSPTQLMAGTVLAGSLITGLNSDLPGLAEAQITEQVYDTVTGAHCLVPQRSRLIGRYDSQVAYGQSRVLLVWTRLIRPDGSSIILDRLSATDEAGYAGIEDGIDYHWSRIFAAAAVSTLLDIGAETGASDRQDALVRALRQGSQDTISQSGQQIVRRSLNVQPTLTVRPGWPLRVLVAKDIVLPPMSGGGDPSCRN